MIKAFFDIAKRLSDHLASGGWWCELGFLLAELGLLELAGLFVVGVEAVLAGLGVNFLVGEVWELLSGGDVRHVLHVTLGEDDVDLLEGSLLGLWVEEVDDWEEDGVHRGEEEVGTPTDVGKHGWSEHDDGEVEQPVRAGRDGVGSGAGLDWVDLGWVQPWKWEPGGTEEGDVGEETDGGSLGSAWSVWNQAGEDEDHGQALTDSTDQEELATTNALNDEPGGGGEDGVDDHVDTTEEERQLVGLADGILEENWEVVDDSVATRELLKHLGRSTNGHTAEVLGLAASEKRRPASTGASSADGVVDNVDLESDLWVLLVESTEAGENGDSLITAVLGQEPAWRLWQENHKDGNEDSKDDLEGDRKSPCQIDDV